MQNILRAMFLSVAFAVFANASAAADAVSPVEASKLVTERLTVGGKVEHPLILTVDDLHQFPPQQLEEVALVRQSGADAGKIENLKGVYLRDILNRAALVTHDHNDVKKMFIVATASDGYKVVFSWSELYNSPIAEGVLVYWEKNGKPLADDEGHIALISTKDIRTGPRHVKWLQSIDVRQIDE
jgi:DMSO/TMAO reductase YedYZ molybdopterin-dependent catalytic subunit